MLVDTGSTISVILKRVFEKHRELWPTVEKTSLRLTCFLGPLAVLGRVAMKIKCGDTDVHLAFDITSAPALFQRRLEAILQGLPHVKVYMDDITAEKQNDDSTAASVITARVVYPRLLEERSSDGRMMVKVHDGLTLNLRKGSVAAQELRVLMEENGRPVTRFYNGEDIEKDLYEDEKEIASVMVTKTGNGVRMEGLLSPSHRIKPAPISEKSEDGAVAHEIHEIEYKEMLDKALYYNNASDGVASGLALESRASVPAKVTVEVFIVMDSWHHRHFQSTSHALGYLCIMMNSANMRYQDASNPQVRLLLTGTEKAVGDSFVVSPKNDNGYLFDDSTLANFKTYAVSKRTQYGDPDVVFLITGRDVVAVYEGKLTTAGLGIGYVSGVCTNFFVALGEDKPGLFTGTHTFTHESAHLLGAKHDGDDPYNAVPGHPGAKRCPWDDGHIMSYINKGPSHHRFSWCTLEQISFVLSRAGAKCWIVQSQGTYVNGVYPGMTVTLKQFCTAIPYEKGYTYEHSTVNQTNCKVRCRFSRTYSIGTERYKSTLSYYEDALDYMSCGDHHLPRNICSGGAPRYSVGKSSRRPNGRMLLQAPDSTNSYGQSTGPATQQRDLARYVLKPLLKEQIKFIHLSIHPRRARYLLPVASELLWVYCSTDGSQEPRLVFPSLLQERSSEGRMVVRVHDDLTLNLRKTSVAAPRLRILKHERGQPVTVFHDGESINKDLYEDEIALATLTVTSNDSGVEMANLRLASTYSPKIQLVVSGVEFSQSESYVVRREGHIHSSPTLTNFSKYAYDRKGIYGDPDLVYLMIKYTSSSLIVV
nr:uncharacterized protein LOC119165169 [Rhipicephalus microplus]